MPSSLIVVFGDEHALLQAASRLAAQACGRLDAHSPFPIPGLARALGARPSRLPSLMGTGAAAGGILGFLAQWWCTAMALPIPVGGFGPCPGYAFMPIAFESAVLGGCLAGFLGVLWANRLPELWHPLQLAPDAERLTRDRFALSVLDCSLPADRIMALLADLRPLSCTVVPPDQAIAAAAPAGIATARTPRP